MNNWCSRTVLECAASFYTSNRIGLLNGIILLLLLVYVGPMDAYAYIWMYTIHCIGILRLYITI